MKKTLITIMAFFAFTLAANSQDAHGYKAGNKLLNIGVGVNSYYDSGIPVGASFEYGINNVISIGANIDYLGSRYNYGYGEWKFSAIYFGARGSYHFNEILNINSDKVDVYGGLTLGFRSFSWKDSYSGASVSGSYGSGLFLGGFAGGKYYFSNSVGAFAELGAIGSTNARIGIGFRL